VWPNARAEVVLGAASAEAGLWGAQKGSMHQTSLVGAENAVEFSSELRVFFVDLAAGADVELALRREVLKKNDRK